ncbi:DUF4446 family protein [Candidatus Saccharibacteria bacterium]|jgi:hypothetical protein|nr:DUF4446 family protein [Candidatus Saccharibacteria bacterium]MBP9131541.1 DUF4446 family protein [Candidatus Saccharibacteria bacterium]
MNQLELVLVVPIVLLSTVSIANLLTISKLKKQIKNVLDLSSSGDLNLVLEEIISSNKNIEQQQTQIKKLYSEVKSISERSLQKTALLRFNPFRDTGGDQSFALCMLDHTNSGVIITAIHSRENTRVYTKEINNGSSQLSLSKEENLVLSKIIKNKK